MLEANIFGKINVLKQNGKNNSNIAILGLNHIAARLYKNPGYVAREGQKIIGFIDVDPALNHHDVSQFPNILGEIGDIRRIISQHNIGKVVLAIDPKDFQKLHEIIQKCETERIDYEILPDSYDTFYEPVEEETFVAHTDSLPEPWFQRMLDFVLGMILFFLFLPSWVVIALAIKLESKGHVLYSQERMGKDGMVFKIYKFRSMYSDAEKMSGPQLATRNDPRITRVGNILRKTRVDELPQLINVITGQMSLVGPRPERPYFVDKYRKIIPRYMERLKVKPGLTGYAQVESGYDESIEDVKKKLKYDLYYIEQQNSLKLYVQILFKTLWVVLSARGQ